MNRHRSILIVGASSAIAQEAARVFAKRGAALCLCARRAEQLESMEQDLRSHGAQHVAGIVFEAEDRTHIPMLMQQASSLMGSIDAVLIAYGSLPDQQACQDDVERIVHEFEINATSVIAVCTEAAKYFLAQPQGQIHPCLAVISSVAGDRGRQSNYIYGAAKGAVSIFLQGLRNRLHPMGIHVLTIKPGFVDTPMTAHLPKNALFASARAVGKRIVSAMDRENDVVYVPGFWRYIMFIIRHIPESLFKTLKL